MHIPRVDTWETLLPCEQETVTSRGWLLRNRLGKNRSDSDNDGNGSNGDNDDNRSNGVIMTIIRVIMRK